MQPVQRRHMGQAITRKLKSSMMHLLDIIKGRSARSKKTSQGARDGASQQVANTKPVLARKLTMDELQKISEAELALKRLQAEKKRLEDILNTASESHLMHAEPNNNVRKETVKVPRYYQPKVAFLLHNVFTSEECDQLLKELESSTQHNKSQDNIEVSTTHSEAMLKRLWPVLEREVPSTWLGNRLIGLSDRCFLERQFKGYRHNPKMDEPFEPIEGKEKSFFSVYIFLNDDYVGGQSSFLKDWKPSAHDVKVKPTKGSILLYQQNLLHEITELQSGEKLVVRLDVMYNTEKRDALSEMLDA